MPFTDESKQRLLELINNIQPAMASNDPAKIVLPLRLLVSTLDVVEEAYQADEIKRLSDAEIRLFLNSLYNSIEEMSASLERTVGMLPETAPASLVEKNKEVISSLQSLKQERKELFDLIGNLLAAENEAVAQHKQVEELKRQKQSLLDVKLELEQVSIEDLQKEVLDLEQSVGPLQAELRQLQAQLEIKRALLSPLHQMMEKARAELQQYEQTGKEQDRLLGIIHDFQDALQPHINSSNATIKKANDALREKVTEAENLMNGCKAAIDKVSQAFSGVKQAQAMIGAYSETNLSVAESIPGVPDATKETLKNMDHQLSEMHQQLVSIDAQLKQALENHQKSSGVIKQLSF